MLVKFLGAIDLLAGFVLICGAYYEFPAKIPLVLGSILILKSTLGFLKNFASWVDFLSGIIILLSIIFQIPSIISIVHGILIIQKGLLSFI
jgi:Sec-independent protein secretion pathway component TatC